MADVDPVPAGTLDNIPDRRPIGAMLVRAGLITPQQADEIADYSDLHHLRFGEAAVKLGMISADALEDVLTVQFAMPGRGGRQMMDKDIAVVHRPRSQKAEQFRSLRNTLAMKWFRQEGGARTLAVVSADTADGRSVVTANLAICFAQVGMRTLLIDADMRNPRQHSLFGLENRLGLSGYLSGRVDQVAYYQVKGFNTLTVIPVGGLPPNPQELLLRHALEDLFRSAAGNFDIVLIDTPAASIGNDYQIIAAAAKGALFVTRERQTRISAATRVINDLEDLGVTVVGATMISG
jgi:chain length determinant protein tyrosine kinase EpsG